MFYHCLVKFDDGSSVPLRVDEEHLDAATIWVRKELPLLTQYQHVTEVTEWKRLELSDEEGEDGE